MSKRKLLQELTKEQFLDFFDFLAAGKKFASSQYTGEAIAAVTDAKEHMLRSAYASYMTSNKIACENKALATLDVDAFSKTIREMNLKRDTCAALLAYVEMGWSAATMVQMNMIEPDGSPVKEKATSLATSDLGSLFGIDLDNSPVRQEDSVLLRTTYQALLRYEGNKTIREASLLKPDEDEPRTAKPKTRPILIHAFCEGIRRYAKPGLSSAGVRKDISDFLDVLEGPAIEPNGLDSAALDKMKGENKRKHSAARHYQYAHWGPAYHFSSTAPEAILTYISALKTLDTTAFRKAITQCTTYAAIEEFLDYLDKGKTAADLVKEGVFDENGQALNIPQSANASGANTKKRAEQAYETLKAYEEACTAQKIPTEGVHDAKADVAATEKTSEKRKK